jgi:C4-dicarboxylate transporter DctQ subunit
MFKTLGLWLSRGAEFITATMLAAMFLTFLLQIFARYVLLTPFGWTLELCLILWVWIVFFGCAFVVRHKDHVTFDIFYNAAPERRRRVLALVICFALILGLGWSLLPTWDYIDWMKIRKTTTVRNPLSGDKIPLRTIFSVYALFMVAVMARYAWRAFVVLRRGTDIDGEKGQ